MLAHLTTTLRHARFRRAVSMLCAVALLAFTFIHATHHHAVADSSSAQIALTAFDGSSDGIDKAEAGHCCSCSTVTMIVAEAALPATAVAARPEAPVWRSPHPHTPAADFRPPIA